MSLSDDPEISAAFGDAPAPEAHSTEVSDPEIASAFGSTSGPSKAYAGGFAGTPVDEVVEHELKSMYASGRAGIHTIHDWLTGKVKTIAEADKLAQGDIKKYGPAAPEKGSAAEKIEGALSSNANPLNWPGWTLAKGGKLLQEGLENFGQVPSQYSTVAGAGAEAAGNIGLGAYGAVKALGIGDRVPAVVPRQAPAIEAAQAPRISDELSLAPDVGRTVPPAPEAAPAQPLSVAPAAVRQPSWEPREASAAAPMVDSEPARGGLALTDTQRNERAQILSRVGVENARESALSGDRGNAATDFQLTKFNQEPAGQAAAAQFEHEKQALTQHASSIVKDTGGSLGLDQDSLQARGQTIAAPFDSLRDWFDKQHAEDYAKAKERLGTTPIGNMDSVQALLDDRTLKNTLAADNKTPLHAAIQNQLDYFRENNPGGLTADTAEQFRQFLNSMWDNKDPAKNRLLSRVKNAVDEDVTKAAGEDVYGPARQRVALEHTLLDDPKGIAKAFDYDPRTPANRATSFDKIPDFVTRLSPDQFAHIVQTLKNMPEEIQPQAKQALAEIRSHYANKLLENGSSTQGQWNAPKVAQTLRNNSANLKIAFKDSPELVGKIQDLDSAGRILKTDQSYPGAAAQASSALKRGMMSHVLTRAASTTGAVVGGAVGSAVGAPVTGAAVGAGAGEALALRAARSSAEKAALKNWEGRTVRLSDLVKQHGGSARP